MKRKKLGKWSGITTLLYMIMIFPFIIGGSAMLANTWNLPFIPYIIAVIHAVIAALIWWGID